MYLPKEEPDVEHYSHLLHYRGFLTLYELEKIMFFILACCFIVLINNLNGVYKEKILEILYSVLQE